MNKKNVARKAILGSILTSASAYAVAFGAMVGFGEADAGSRQVPSSNCHAGFDDNGSTVNNSGALTYTGTGTKSIYCPMVSDNSVPMSSGVNLDVFGSEGTNGAISRTCECTVNPITCGCAPGTSWTNNSGGIDGLVADNVSTSAWAIAPAEKFGYILHTMTTNSSLAGMEMFSP